MGERERRGSVSGERERRVCGERKIARAGESVSAERKSV